MKPDQHKMWTNWGGRSQSFGAFTAQVRQYLEMLRAMHPDFSHWQMLGNMRFEVVAADYANLGQLLLEKARPEKDERERYSALDDKFNVTPATESKYGFFSSFFTSIADAPPRSQDFGRPDYVELKIHSGDNYHNSVEITWPVGRPDLLNHDMVRSILLDTVDFWQAASGQVFSPGFVQALEAGRQFNFGMLRAVWFAYLRHPLLAASLRPDDVPCRLDHIGDDALLFTLTPQPPLPSSIDDVARARQLQALFDRIRFDHDVTLFGWPYDPDEVRYTMQITGAPADRAYVVAFAAFDGYDAERRVLLFARLFRGLPPQWGTDLHPIYREDRARLERLPYVVQARQHLAAVEYAGADTPIEWHVGISETAAALATLLNEWAAIPPRRLRVVYTPFEQ